MTSGLQLVLALIIGLAFLIVLILKTKIHAFLALIMGAVVIGLLSGLDSVKTAEAISAGFGGTLGGIGIIIGFGVMMGELFQASGAATQMARSFLKLFGRGKEEAALALTGFVVSIPIFCDSGFVILSPIAKALSRQTKKSMVSLGLALAGGLVITHSLIPPTPGPLGAAGTFGIDVGKFILLGIVIAIPMALTTTIYARWLGRRIYQIPSGDGEGWERPAYQEPGYDQLLHNPDEKLPGAFLSFLPLIVPIILILCNTITKAAGGGGAPLSQVLIFLGTPIIAVGIGLIIAIYTLARHTSRAETLSRMESGIRSAGIIILVTGGGGALGRVLQTSGIGSFIAEQISVLPIPVIVLPFLIATLIRFAQGSGTVAMLTAAGITAPIVSAAGGSMILGTFAACIGSLFFSYFNDSFFWVTNRLMGIEDTKEQIRCWSFTTTIAWATGFAELLIINFFFGKML
ncbi:MAG: GntP family permease [Spirochaetaceae bacterium]|jgi:GntP family gluconate:H+ symporter|nr:GntP family permease [Spirochaetaceae bacterium]